MVFDRAEAGLERNRLLKWILAYAGLSAAWTLGEGERPELALAVAELAAPASSVGPCRPGKVEQWADVMIVGGAQSVDVTFAQSTRIGEAASTPRKPPPTKLYNKEVGYEPSVAAIAIWKEMYLHEPVVKS
jgi:hypothetical protein